MTVYGYLRVSTDKQDCENQKIGVEALAETRGFQIESWIVDDGVSGTKEPEKRQLGKLLKKIKTGDVIICSELSRLGRKLFMVISILEHCMKVGAKVLTVKDGYELGDNVQSKVLAFAFGLVAELEREMISKRTKEALQRLKSNGEKLGRPFGCHNKKHKADNFPMEQFIELFKSGLSVEKISKKIKFSSTYFYNYEQSDCPIRKEIKQILKNGRMKKSNIKKEVIRLSDFKVFQNSSEAWNNTFLNRIKAGRGELKVFENSIKKGLEYHGFYFEYKDFYDGKKV